MLAHQTTRRVVEDVLGADTPIAYITRDQCRDLLETLRWLPVNMAKKFGDARVREAAKAARAGCEAQSTTFPVKVPAHLLGPRSAALI